MKKIQVLGTGCPKCRKLAEAAEQAARALGIEYALEKVTDINQIVGFGVMMTPALVIDGVVKCVGRIPAEAELKTYLS